MSGDPNSFDPADACAASIVALINSSPRSPRRDELRDLVQQAITMAVDQAQVDRAGVPAAGSNGWVTVWGSGTFAPSSVTVTNTGTATDYAGLPVYVDANGIYHLTSI